MPDRTRVSTRSRFTLPPHVHPFARKSGYPPEAEYGQACVAVRYVDQWTGDMRTMTLRLNDAKQLAYDLLSAVDLVDEGE